MTRKVLISAPYLLPVLEIYRSLFDAHGIVTLVPPIEERLSEAELLQWVEDIDGIICGDDQLSERVLRAAPRLKVISKWGTGVDSIDVQAAGRMGIIVRNTPNAFSDPLADSVLGYMLSFARQIPWMDRDMRAGTWRKRECFSLNESTLGIIGVGNVGRAVVRRARAFGIRVLGNDIAELRQDFLLETGLAMVDKDELLREADFISLNCDLNPTSYRLIGAREFGIMKQTTVIINTARGAIIDEAALVSALEHNRIAGAALDVFENEPLPAKNPLRRFDNILLAPHNANSGRAAWRRVHEKTIANLIEGLDALARE